MFHFLHGYEPELWAGYEKNDMIGPHDGVRLVQYIHMPDSHGFNEIAKKDGDLWNIIAKDKRPFYIDRLQGGCYIFEYPYDQNLLDEYRELLGDNFLGFQMHEWMSNYRSDLIKVASVSAEDWDAEHINAALQGLDQVKFAASLESMTTEEFIAAGKPQSAQEFYDNMTAIYKKRLAKYKDIVAADSGYIMSPFEIALGVNMIMPEIGANAYGDIVLLLSYARAITAAHGVKFGTYYECHGGKPFSTPYSNPEGKNEWYCDISSVLANGERGGSSRSLQKRIYLYSYLSGAEYISEEWGAYNTFCDKECTVLSEYGKVKKNFIDFTRKYADIGEKMAPIVVVLPSDLPTYVVARDTESHNGDAIDQLYQFPLPEALKDKLPFVRNSVDKVFRSLYDYVGTEHRGLRNTRLPDAVDMLTEAEETTLDKYAYIVDLTCNPEFAARHDNIISIDEIGEKLNELLPCKVEGECHWLVNEKKDGTHYLTIFNHHGIVRSIEEGEYSLPEATVTVEITPKAGALHKLEGGGTLEQKGGRWQAILPPGEFLFMEF